MYQPRIFVVDDDASVRKALKRLIQSAGMLVDTFGSAEEFLNADTCLPDCLILDVRMPGLSGLELQQQLIENNRRVPVIFICGEYDEIARHVALNAGAIAFLFKPFDAKLLLDGIERSLQRDKPLSSSADS